MVNAISIIFVLCHTIGKECNYFINFFYQASTFNLILCHIDKRASKFSPVIVKLKKKINHTTNLLWSTSNSRAKSAVFYTWFRMCKNTETFCWGFDCNGPVCFNSIKKNVFGCSLFCNLKFEKSTVSFQLLWQFFFVHNNTSYKSYSLILFNCSICFVFWSMIVYYSLYWYYSNL